MQVQSMPSPSQRVHPSSKHPLLIPAFSPAHASSRPSTHPDPPHVPQPQPRPPPGPLSILRSAIKTDGFRGLWKGHTGTIVRDSGGCAGWFSVKELVAEALIERRSAAAAGEPARREVLSVKDKKELQPWESGVAGAIAGAVCAFVFYPADTVKSAMQTEDELRPRPPSKQPVPQRASTFVGTLTRMYANHGLRGLYMGCGMTVVRAVPSSGILFVVYDGLSAWLDRG